jgi:hypothetical protein
LRAGLVDCRTGGTSLYLLDDLDGNPVIELSVTNGSPVVDAVNTWGRNGLVGRFTTNQSPQQEFNAYDMQGNTVQQILSNGTVDNW